MTSCCQAAWAENVAFFDDQIDMDRVWEALEAAALKQDILAMPMKTDTFVGDMEQMINQSLKQLNITRIVIAHRKETIAAADLVFDITTGRMMRPMPITASPTPSPF